MFTGLHALEDALDQRVNRVKIDDGDDAEKYRIFQADVSVEVERLVRVVPKRVVPHS